MPADLWRFAQALYQRPGVETACLQLQAQGGDVCLLLCAAWLGRRGVACNRERAEQLRRLAEPWQAEVVTPLRRLRRQWRGAAGQDDELAALREQLKQLELAAERLQLQRLESCCAGWPATIGQDPLAWLEQLMPITSGPDRDALQLLHVAALQP